MFSNLLRTYRLHMNSAQSDYSFAGHVQERGAINTGDKNDQDPRWHYLLDVIKSTKHSQSRR